MKRIRLIQIVATIGLDLGKSVFQVHCVDGDGVVGLEACATSHYWAREIGAFGHQVRMIPPIYVNPYVECGKTDAADAEAICDAVARPTMRFVPIKDAE
jgi:transposase